MNNKRFLPILLLGIVCVSTGYSAQHLWRSYHLEHEIFYKDGWMAARIDTIAVDRYHRCANALADDSDPLGLEACWQEAMREATRLESEWGGLTSDQKRKMSTEPFWKSGRGEPRRLSRQQRDAIKEYFRWTPL